MNCVYGVTSRRFFSSTFSHRHPNARIALANNAHKVLATGYPTAHSSVSKGITEKFLATQCGPRRISFREFCSVEAPALGAGFLRSSRPCRGIVTFKLADIGEGITEVELLQWRKAEGSEIEEGKSVSKGPKAVAAVFRYIKHQNSRIVYVLRDAEIFHARATFMDEVCEVQSDKSAVDISSPYTGRIVKFHHKAGAIIRIGTPLMDIDVPNEGEAEAGAKDSQTSQPSVLAETPSAAEQTTHRSAPAQQNEGPRRVSASPVCRAFAREHGIDLASVPATGLRGQVTKEDVMQFLAQKGGSGESTTPASSHTAAPTTSSRTKSAVEGSSGTGFTPEIVPEVVHLTSGIAKGMVKRGTMGSDPGHIRESWCIKNKNTTILKSVLSMNVSLTVPHMSIQEDVDMSSLIAARSALNNFLASSGGGEKLTITALLIKAVSTALKSVPIMNSKFDTAEQNKYTLYHNHNVSVAIDTPHGLLVPNIKNVERRGLRDIQKELLHLQELAYANRLTRAHLTDGTISISNVGVVGGTAVRPILFDGQATILGFGRTQTLPRYNTATKVFDPKPVMNVTASVDHRHVDGATVARFMKVLREVVENFHLLSL